MKITIENAKKVLIKYLGKNTEKVNHSIRIAEIAKKLAEKCGENVKEAVIEALLHDIGKSMDEQEMLNLCLRKETTVYDFELYGYTMALHGKVGAIIFEQEFDKSIDPIAFDRIKQAISYHVAGGEEHMSKLDKIIYIADNIEAKKQKRYENKNIRNLVDKLENNEKIDIDEYVKIIIEEKKKRAKQEGRIVNPLVDNILEK